MENINIKSKEVLVKRNSEGELVVTSRQVSEDFEKEHSKVIRTIENLFQGIAKSGDPLASILLWIHMKMNKINKNIFNIL